MHIYAPTEDAEDQAKDEFYARLQDVLERRNRHDMLIITGDINAKVGNDNRHYERVMGKARHRNKERQWRKTVFNELVITGTLFPHKAIHKETWVSPNGTTRNHIDHVNDVLINKRFRNSVKDTRVFRSADV